VNQKQGDTSLEDSALMLKAAGVKRALVMVLLK